VMRLLESTEYVVHSDGVSTDGMMQSIIQMVQMHSPDGYKKRERNKGIERIYPLLKWIMLPI
jgi:putative lipoic acid-binding regulatory protein